MLRLVGRGIEGGCESPPLPGVWHWLEPMMNVTCGSPKNQPTPGSPSVPRWKFPFSKPISGSGKAVERPVPSQGGRQSFSNGYVQHRSRGRAEIGALATLTLPNHVNLSGSLNRWWAFNLVKWYTHTHTHSCDFISNSDGVYFGSHHFPAAETALKSRTI